MTNRISELLELMRLMGGENEASPNTGTSVPYVIGETYFIRTATHAHTGRLAAVCPQELVIADAAWIADTGRFSEALKTCNFAEVEMFPKGHSVVIGRGALIDAVMIDELPTETK